MARIVPNDITPIEGNSDSPSIEDVHTTQSQDLQGVGTAPILTSLDEMENLAQPQPPQKPSSPIISIHPPSPAGSIKRHVHPSPNNARNFSNTAGMIFEQSEVDPTAGALCNIAYFRKTGNGVDWLPKELPVKGVTHTNESLTKMGELWQAHLKKGDSAFDFMEPTFRWIHLPANNKDWAEVQSCFLRVAFMILLLILY